MELIGSVENIIYRNAENGYTVFELQSDGGERVSVVGALPLCNRGERVELTGTFIKHPKYGTQFKVSSVRTLAPATLHAVEKYLSSGLIRGVGEATARAIVSAFGMDTLRILDDEPDRLAEIPGIGMKRRQMIQESYHETRLMRDILLALEPYGITVHQALKLYRIYGDMCLARIEENPYQMIRDVEGVGFLSADRIAQNVAGFSFDSLSRIRAGLDYALLQARLEFGHTYLPRVKLLEKACALLGVAPDSCAYALDRMIGDGELVEQQLSQTVAVFQPAMSHCEITVAERLLGLAKKPVDNPFLSALCPETPGDLHLAPQQAEAVRLAMSQGVLIITGGPGTGKTTIIRYIVRVLASLGMEYALAAPTGRAAKRMTEATGCEAKTLHRLLEYIPGEGFTRNHDNPLMIDMLIVDEMSMVDAPLMQALLSALVLGTRIVLVGDSDQLPSVGAGDVLRDMIASGVLPVVRLTEIFRQSEQSLIVTNAHRINLGHMPLLSDSSTDFTFEEIPSADRALDRVLDLCTHSSQLGTSEPFLDVQVLAPMKKGVLGVNHLNARLQASLNPHAPDKREYARGEVIFREGDKVMQIKNNYKTEWRRRGSFTGEADGTGVYNGDIATILSMDPSARTLSLAFDDDRLAVYDFTQLDELELAYCISIHKSQGSEFPIVLLPLISGPPMLMTRNLLYTAVTRAKRSVFCIGRREAIRQMVENNRTARRYTTLAQRLREFSGLSE